MFLIIKYPEATYYYKKDTQHWTFKYWTQFVPVVAIQKRWNGPLPTTAHIKLIWILTLMILHVHQEGMKEIWYSHNEILREKCEFSSRSKKWLERAGKSGWLWILLWLGSGARVRVPLHGLGLA